MFPCNRKGIILVCTDAAARGIDIPDISHVVQADFALNAIDFIHRVQASANPPRCTQPSIILRAPFSIAKLSLQQKYIKSMITYCAWLLLCTQVIYYGRHYVKNGVVISQRGRMMQ